MKTISTGRIYVCSVGSSNLASFCLQPLTGFQKSFWLQTLGRWFPDLMGQQSHLEGSTPQFLIQLCLRWDMKTGVSNKFPGEADVLGWDHMRRTTWAQ